MSVFKRILANPLVRYYRDILLSWRSSRVHPSAIILPGAVLRLSDIGERATVGHDVNLVNVRVGKYSYISVGARLANCVIGPFCSIAGNVVIGPGKHPLHFVSSHPYFYSKQHPQYPAVDHDVDFLQNKDVSIGADVWIGLNAVVLDGVAVGDGAVIAAGAVVTSDVPCYAVVAGVPAKIVKYRFDEATREGLLRTKWWERDDDWLAQNRQKFLNVDLFLKEFGKGS